MSSAPSGDDDFSSEDKATLLFVVDDSRELSRKPQPIPVYSLNGKALSPVGGPGGNITELGSVSVGKHSPVNPVPFMKEGRNGNGLLTV